MKNTNKKGFTIVELVIVIAVIAILAAVLIPTFASIVKKANAANDTVVAKNMNTALAEYSALNGKPETFDEVLTAIEEAGYVLANLNAKADGNLYGWDKTNNQIVYIDAEGKTIYQNVDFVAGDLQFVVADSSVELPEGFESNAVVDMTKPEGPKALKAALEDGKSITLSNDIVVDAEIIIPEGSDVTLDLGTHKYTTDKTNAGSVSQTSKYIKVSEGASLTIQNGTFEGRGIMNNGGTITIKDGTAINAVDVNGGGCIKNKTGGTVIIEGGTFNAPNFIEWDAVNKGGACAVENNGGTLVIKGGTFTTNTESYLISNLSGEMTIEGGTFKSYRGVVACEGGSIDIKAGTFTLENHPDTGKAPSGHHFYVVTGGTVTIGSNVVLNGLDDKIYKDDSASITDNRSSN